VLRRRLSAFGLVIDIDADDARVLALLDRQLPQFPSGPRAQAPDVQYRVTSRHQPDRVVVVRGRRTIATMGDVAGATDRLVSDLQSTFGRRAAGWTFVHAGVVAIGARAVLLPALSGAGKTTLVAALLRAGARYGSDEFAVLDRDGHVHPYARHLALRAGDRFVPPAEFGGQMMPSGLPAAAVIFTAFQPPAALDLHPIPPGQTVLRLLEHCLGARERPKETLQALQALARHAPGFAGVRGEADETARDVIASVRTGWPPPLA
jgi:hypothetical protein